MSGANGNGAGGPDGSISLALAVVDALDDAGLELLAERLAPYLPQPKVHEDRWLSTADAAAYLGLTRNALHKLTAARAIPFAQDRAGGKLWFLRSELDAWRRG